MSSKAPSVEETYEKLYVISFVLEHEMYFLEKELEKRNPNFQKNDEFMDAIINHIEVIKAVVS